METLLENLCRVYGFSGGTIHQFFDIKDPLFNRFQRVYQDYRKCGLEFNTPRSFKKLSTYCRIELIAKAEEKS